MQDDRASPTRFSSGGSSTSGRSSADFKTRRVSSPIPIPGTGPKTVAVNLMVVVIYLRIKEEGEEEEECSMDMMLTPNVVYNKITGDVTDLQTLGTIPDDNAVAVIGARVKLVTPPKLPDPVWRVNLKH